jgi:hypothetical protein
MVTDQTTPYTGECQVGFSKLGKTEFYRRISPAASVSMEMLHLTAEKIGLEKVV